MDMRLRLPELLDEHKPPLTPYAAAKASGGRINQVTLYRLVRAQGRVQNFNAELCEALCQVLGVQPADLFELDTEKSKRRKSA
jgi:DNA-binding Xre family transcriptional regulator